MNLRKMIFILCSLPKTIYFNFRALKLEDAMYLPFIISYKTKFGEIHKNRIKLCNWKEQHYRIIFGFGGSRHILSNKKAFLSIGKDATIIFNGKSNFGEGISLRCDKGNLTFGKNFSTNKNCCISCNYIMRFGKDVLLGWNINIRDTDGHKIYREGKIKESQKCIDIGNHVWICSYSDLLKGAKIGNDSVIAWRSCMLKPIEKNNVLVGGMPAKVIQDNINWEI